MKLEDLTRVANLEQYWSNINNSNLTPTQKDFILNIGNAENLIRHVRLMANQFFLKEVESNGFDGILEQELSADFFDSLISNPALVPFVQQLLMVLMVTGLMEVEEVAD